MRAKVTEAIRRTFHQEGYSFFQGFIYNINQSSLKLPALWLNPVELTGKTGRDEGMMTYRVTLYFFVQSEKYSEDQKEGVWADLEARAVAAYNALLSDPNVAGVSGIACEPDEFAYTQFGEISLKVTFSVDTYYCGGA